MFVGADDDESQITQATFAAWGSNIALYNGQLRIFNGQLQITGRKKFTHYDAKDMPSVNFSRKYSFFLAILMSMACSVASFGNTSSAVVWRISNGAESVNGHGKWQAGERYCAGSVSKLLTALLTLRAVESGIVVLDEDVGKIWPNLIEQQKKLSLAMLLEHTAGIAGSDFAEYAAQKPGFEPEQYAKENMPFPLRWEPGQHYSYSNAGITLAAAVVCRAWDGDFDELMRREVLQPLEMDQSDFSGAGAILSYSTTGLVMPRWAMPVRPAGSLVCTAEDLGKLLKMLLARGRLPNGKIFLSENSIMRMERGEQSIAARAGLEAYGLGNFGFVEAGRIWRGHWGRTEGFQATLGYLPEHGRGFVILSNQANRIEMATRRSETAAQLTAELPAISNSVAGGNNASAVEGIYVNFSHDMKQRAWLFALLESKRINSTPSGLRITQLRDGSSTEWTEVSANRYQAAGVPVATGAFGKSTGRDFWVDGESFVRISQFAWIMEVGIILVGALLAMIMFVLFPWWIWRFYKKKEWVEICISLAGTSLFALLAGYFYWGVWGSGAELGSFKTAAVSLMALSIVGPLLSIVGLIMAARARRSGLLIVAIFFVAWTLQLTIRGWIPLVTW